MELCSLVSTLARDIESCRYELARNIAESCAQPSSVRTKWKCWAMMTGALRRPSQGILCELCPDLGVWGECSMMHATVLRTGVESRKDIQRRLDIMEAVIAALYEFDDEEFCSLDT